MPILVHHLENSRSQRVLWLLEELGQPYELVLYKRNPQTMRAPPELRQVHPLGKSPVVTLDGLVLAESGAIIETLVEKFGPQLMPARDTEAFRHYRFFLHYAEGSLGTPLLVALLVSRIKSAPLPFFVKPIARRVADGLDENYVRPELERHLPFIEEHLSKNAWFAGEAFSAADIQMSFGLEAAASRGRLAEAPATRRWLETIHAREAYKRALERGGPYEYA